MGKTYWMLVTNEKNFNISRREGFNTQGIESSQRRKASRLSPDDRLIYYLTDRRVFAATATVKSEPFEDDEPIWEHHREDETFPHRVEIKSDVVLAENQFVDAREVGPGLEYVRKWPPEDWPLAFIGPLHILPQRDFTFLEEEMRRARARRKSSRKRRGRRGRGNRSPVNGENSSPNRQKP